MASFVPVTVKRADRGWQLDCGLLLPHQRDDVFPFFADATNLERITPDSLRFEILTPLPITMAAGTLIDYRIRIRGIPVTWRTEISVWDPPNRFVDRQLRGPYRWWIHEHRFEDHPDGTWCSDTVHYGVPGGTIVNQIFVERDVRRIFEFRQQSLLNIFGNQIEAARSTH